MYIFNSTANTAPSVYQQIHFVVTNVQGKMTNRVIAQMLGSRQSDAKEQAKHVAEVSILKNTGKLLCTGRSTDDVHINSIASPREKWNLDKNEPMGSSAAYAMLHMDSQRPENERMLSMSLLREPYLKNNLPPVHLDAGMKLLIAGFPDDPKFPDSKIIPMQTPEGRKFKMPGCTKGVGTNKGWIEFWRMRSHAAALSQILGQWKTNYIATCSLTDVPREKFETRVEQMVSALTNGQLDYVIASELNYAGDDYKVSWFAQCWTLY